MSRQDGTALTAADGGTAQGVPADRAAGPGRPGSQVTPPGGVRAPERAERDNADGAVPEAAAEPAGPAVSRDGVAVVYRTPGGWRVGDDELPDLVNAIVLADLLAGELPSAARPRGGTSAGTADAARLKTTIAQLEHALANRVRVEQAIGVLAERHRLQPRKAFELLRGAARSRGRRVQDLAEEVVGNVTNPLLPIAEELARPPKPVRTRGRARQRI